MAIGLNLIPGVGSFVWDLLETLGVANPYRKAIEYGGPGVERSRTLLGGDKEGTQVRLGGWLVPWEPLIDLRARKRLTVQDIPGRDAPVIFDAGLAAMGVNLVFPLHTTMRPLLSFKEKRSLYRDLGDVNKLLRAADPISIECDLLESSLPVDPDTRKQMVKIEALYLNTPEGDEHTILLTLSCLSVDEANLVIDEEGE